MNEAEWFWSHEPTRSRGHSDGLTNPAITGVEEIFEFKSMGRSRAAKLAKGEPDDPVVVRSFRDLAPEYYAQGQEYMRLSGRRRWRGVLMSIEYPYPMREVAMEYDPFFAGNIGMKYERVLKAAATRTPPLACCGNAKSCPAARACSVARIS